MPLPRQRFQVELATEDGERIHQVEILNGDQLRAELEGPRHGMTDPKARPQHYATLVCWAALSRTGDYDGTFRDFMAECALIELVKKEGAELVDPTRPAPGTGSPSSWPPTSEADLDGGSTLAATNVSSPPP
jgi:hypothetical protein